MSFNDIKKFKPSTKKDWKRYGKRARIRERRKAKEKAALADPKAAAKRRKLELKEIRRAERIRVKNSWKIISQSKALMRMAKNLPSKTVEANKKIFLKKYFQILADKENRDLATIDPKKGPKHWPLLMPVLDKMGPDKPKANEQFVYDVKGLWPQFSWEELQTLLAAALGKWVQLPDMTMTWRFTTQAMDQIIGVFDSHSEGSIKTLYGIRNPIKTRKLWLRFQERYYKVGKKVNGKKSKWIDNGADTEAPKKARAEGPADSEKAAKKKLKKAKNLREEIHEEKAPVRTKKLKKKNRDKDLQASVEKTSKKRIRLPNLSDESRIKKIGDASYRGQLGELYALIPKKGVDLAALTKLAKKEKIDSARVRAYISLLRKSESVEVR